MVNKIYDYIQENNMLLPDDKVIAGVSGGADSVCLLHVLMEIQERLPLKLYVVHIEHGMRGEESQEDAAFTEELAARYGLPFRMFSYKVEEEAKRAGLGCEEMGRLLRYRSFEKALEEFGADKIAVAHNKNDNAETILLNLFRGSGLKGLSGIPAKRGRIIRPLLGTQRCEIEKWLSDYQIVYRQDRTNMEAVYTRNKMRIHVIPYAEEHINSRAVANIDRAGGMIGEAMSYLEKQTDKAYGQYVFREQYEQKIILEDFLKEDPVIRKNLIRKCLSAYKDGLKDMGSIHIEAVYQLAEGQAGKSLDLPNQLTAKRGYKELTIKKNREKDIRTACKVMEPEVPGICMYGGYEFRFTVDESKKNTIIPEKIYTKWFDYDKIVGNLRLRTRETGDYIEVNCSGGRKKLKSYFIDEKIDKEIRDSIPLLSDGAHIIWVVGYRISERYKVTPDTKRILKVQVNGGNEHGR